MAIIWDEVQKEIFPIKNYDDMVHRFKASIGYRFVHDTYNFTLPKLEIYTQKLLGGDPRGRYVLYNSRLKTIISNLYKAGVEDVVGLIDQTASRDQYEIFVEQSGIAAVEIAMLLKYLVYWVIPGEKYLGGLVRDASSFRQAIVQLGNIGIRCNLELLQAGLTPEARDVLAAHSGLPAGTIDELVNRADFSRLPWASKATISNIIGAGYGSLKQLANANPEQLTRDFLRYGQSIGKNLKQGNEIESSYRIARIIPPVIREG